MKTCQTLHYNKTSATFLFPYNHDALYHYKLKTIKYFGLPKFFYYVNPLNLHSIPHMFEIEIINVQFSIAHLSWPRRNTIHLISKKFLSYFQRSKTQIMGMSQSIMNFMMFHPVLRFALQGVHISSRVAHVSKVPGLAQPDKPMEE